MARNDITTRIARASSSSSSSFLTSLFGGSAATTVQIFPAAEITDWEFVNTSDAADDDEDLDVLSDVEESESKSSGAQSVSSSLNQNSVSESDLESDPRVVSGLAAVATAAHMQMKLPEAFESCKRSDEASEDEGDQEEDSDEDDDVDLDDELVPWGLGGKLGRQRIWKLGARACTSKRTTKKFAHTVKSRGCVSGKHGLGRKA